MPATNQQALLTELHYLPNIYYMAALAQQHEIHLEANETFQKQTCRNRCYVLTAQGPQRLTVPVVRSNSSMPIAEVQIDERTKWRLQHWRTIESAYRKAPYYQEYAWAFKEVLLGEQDRLFDLNYQLLTLCLQFLQVQATIFTTKAFLAPPATGFADIRSGFCVKPERGTVNASSYTQLFGDSFTDGLSVIDLLFALGPEAKAYLHRLQLKS